MANSHYQQVSLLIFWAGVFFVWILTIVILIFVVSDWFLVEIDDLYEEHWETLQYNGECAACCNNTNREPHGSIETSHLLAISCLFDRLEFSGHVIDNPWISLIGGPIEGPQFEEEVPIDSSTCNWIPSDPSAKFKKCRVFLKDIGTLPGGFRGVFEGQDWYEADEESFDFSFESGAGKGALVVCIFAGTVASCYFFCVSIIFCVASISVQQKCIQDTAWPTLFCLGACMAGLLVCVIPFNQGNICGKQGSNAVHIALICMISCALACCVCLSAFVAKQIRVSLFKSNM